MAVAEHIYRFRTEEQENDDSKYKAFMNEENSLRTKTEKKRKEVQKAVEEENYKREQKHNLTLNKIGEENRKRIMRNK